MFTNVIKSLQHLQGQLMKASSGRHIEEYKFRLSDIGLDMYITHRTGSNLIKAHPVRHLGKCTRVLVLHCCS